VNTHALPFTPRDWQRPLLNDSARAIVGVIHRRAGKSTALLWRGLRKAATWRRPHLPEARRNLVADPPRVVHVLPQRVQWSRTGLWDRLEAAAKAIPGAEVFKSELRVVLPGGGVYQAGGMDNPDGWRGGYADEVIEDEADDVTAGGLDMVVEPMLADYLGTRLYSGTPKGNGRLQALYDTAGAQPGWSRYLLRWQDTHALPDEAITALRSKLTAEEFAQEMECSFSAPNAGAYYAALLDAAEREGRITRLPHEPRLPVETWWDIGMDDATAIWFVQREPGGAIRVIDYLEASGEGFGYYAQQLAARDYSYSAHRLPHDVQVREMGAGGRSRLETLQDLGVRPIKPGVRARDQREVADGINAVRQLLPRCWFDAERTLHGRKMLRRYHRKWHEDRGVWASTPVHDETSHAADAFREGAVNMPDLRERRRHVERALTDYDPLRYGR
jgi:hypothetical protein